MMLVTISRLPRKSECPKSVNRFCGVSEHQTAMNCIVLFLNRVVHGQSLQSNLVYNFTNMHAVSYSSDFFTCSSRVNIWEPTCCYAVSLLSAVFRVGLPSCLIPTAMSDSNSLNISFLELMIPSKDERVFICDSSDLASQIIFAAWWGLMNVDWKSPIA